MPSSTKKTSNYTALDLNSISSLSLSQYEKNHVFVLSARSPLLPELDKNLYIIPKKDVDSNSDLHNRQQETVRYICDVFDLPESNFKDTHGRLKTITVDEVQKALNTLPSKYGHQKTETPFNIARNWVKALEEKWSYIKTLHRDDFQPTEKETGILKLLIERKKTWLTKTPSINELKRALHEDSTVLRNMGWDDLAEAAFSTDKKGSLYARLPLFSQSTIELSSPQVSSKPKNYAGILVHEFSKKPQGFERTKNLILKLEEIVYEKAGLLKKTKLEAAQDLNNLFSKSKTSFLSPDEVLLKMEINAVLGGIIAKETEEISLQRELKKHSEFKNLKESDVWRLFIDGNKISRGQYGFENESGYMAGMFKGFQHVLQTRTQKLTTDYLIKLHDKAVDGVWNTMAAFSEESLKTSLDIRTFNYGFRKGLRPSDRSNGFGLTLGRNLSHEGISELIDLQKNGRFKLSWTSSHSKLAPKINKRGDFTPEKGERIGELLTLPAKNEAELRAYSDRVIKEYYEEIDVAQTEDAKRTAIVKLCRNLETAHLFRDGNARTISLLVNKLLLDEGLSPTLLKDPNMFDGFSLKELASDVANGQLDFQTLISPHTDSGVSHFINDHKNLYSNFFKKKLNEQTHFTPEQRKALIAYADNKEKLEILEEKYTEFQNHKKKKGPDFWDKDFKTIFEIKASSNKSNPDEIYKKTKKFLVDEMANVHEKHLNFTPKIRFNDVQKKIEIGYNYFDFYDFLQNSFFKKEYFPSYLTDRTFSNIENKDTRFSFKKKDRVYSYKDPQKKLEIFSTENQIQSVLFKKDGTVMAYKPNHPFFQNDLAKMDTAPRQKSPPTSLANTLSKDELFSHLKENSLRIFWGEDHLNPESFDYLIKNMAHLKEGTLGLEGFCYETHQPLLDTWIKQPLDIPLPIELTFSKQDNILYAAKEHGVRRILALDSESVSCANLSTIERLKYMNYIAHKIIAHEIDPKENFIAVLGAYHVSETTIIDGKSNHTIPGLSQLIPNTKSIVMLDVPDLKTDIGTRTTLAHSSEGITQQIHPDIVIKGTNYRKKGIPPFAFKKLDDIFGDKRLVTQHEIKPETASSQSSVSTQHEIKPETTSSQSSVSTQHEIKPETTSSQSSVSTQHEIKPETSSQNSVSTQSERMALDTADIVRKSPQQNKALSLPQRGFDKGMTALGMAGGINSIYRGDIVGGVVNIAESTADITGFGTETILTNKNLIKSATQGKKVAAAAVKTATKFAKALPIIGAGFSAYSVIQSVKDSASAKGSADILKARINLLLDGAIFISALMPGPGTVASLGLVVARLLSDTIIDQITDPEAYKKTWAILHNGEATFFEKAIAAPKGAIQFVWSKSPNGLFLSAAYKFLTNQTPINKIDALGDTQVQDFFTTENTQDSFVIDFTSGTFSNHAGALNVTIDKDHISFSLKGGKSVFKYDKHETEKNLDHALCTQDGPPRPAFIRMGLCPHDTPGKKMVIKMSQGVTYHYQLKQTPVTKGPILRSLTEVRLEESSFTSTYNAANAETDVTFIAPNEDPTFLQDSVTSNALGKGFDSFHYKIFGGKKENIYILSQQNVTLTCGSGKNFIQLPFDDQSSSRTLILQGFRDDESCTIELKNLRSDNELLQQAKLKLGEGLNLYIGQTTIKIKPSGKLEKLLIRTEDAILALDVADIVSTPSDTDYSFKDIINSTYMGYKNLWKKDIEKRFSTIKDHNGMIDFLKDLLDKINLYNGIKGKDFYTDLLILTQHVEKERNDLSEKKQRIQKIFKGFNQTSSIHCPQPNENKSNVFFTIDSSNVTPKQSCYTKEEYENFQKQSFQDIKNKTTNFLSKNFNSNKNLTGTSGEDLFIINDKECGHTQILKFDDLKDRFNIAKLKTNEDVKSLISQATQKDADVFISFDEYNSITIKDTMLSQLDPNDFILGNIAY